MQYLANCLTCILLFFSAASTSSTFCGSQSIRKSAHNSMKHDRGSIFSWFTGSPALKCGHHILSRMGGRLKKPGDKNRVINGTPVYPGQFPYAVRVFFHYNRGWLRYDSECGGTLISDSWVLTAAHCFQGWNKEKNVAIDRIIDTVMIGDYSIEDANDGARMLDVDRYYIHPEFKPSIPWDNDIALLKISETLKFDLKSENGGNGAVNSVCLPTKDVDYAFSNREVWLFAGWGKNEKDFRPDTMLYYQVSLVDYSYCKTKYSGFGDFNPDHTICTFSEAAGANKGDSGSGVVRILDDGRYELVGIASGASFPNRIVGPDVYTNVFNYMDWIRSHLGDSGGSKGKDELISFQW